MLLGEWEPLLPAGVRETAAELAARTEAMRTAGVRVYPPAPEIFRALTLCPPEKAKVLILGQDPYHEPGQAHGLAFSVGDGVRLPPSLRNIYQELAADLGIRRTDGDLRGWAEEGVLLLNTVLTVEEGKANSHAGLGWQTVTAAVIRAFAALPRYKVCALWGMQAVRVFQSACGGDVPGCGTVQSTHPSPLSARRGTAALPAFLGSRPFSGINALLEANGVPGVNWER